MKTLFRWWKRSPRLRFTLRTLAVVVGGYIANTVRSGEVWTWQSLAVGAGTAAFTAIVGLLGLEPFVGSKPNNVEVPPSADIR